MKSKKIRPLHDRVVVKPIPNEKKTESGLIIIDSFKGEPLKGVVYAVGNGTSTHKMTVSEGDTVQYNKGAGQEITVDGEKVLIMFEREILSILCH